LPSINSHHANIQGLEMNANDRRARLLRMVRQVEEHNIYRWAARFLTQLAATRTAGAETASGIKIAAP